MIPKTLKPKNIEEYIQAAPEAVQEKLLKMHKCIKAAAPGATESLKWGMPAYSYQKILATFAVFRHHIGFYPMASAVSAFAESLSEYNTAKGSIQFPLNQPLPVALIAKIIRFRVRETSTGDIKWRS